MIGEWTDGRVGAVLLAAFLAQPSVCTAATLTTLHVFDGTNGSEPLVLTEAANGTFFGATGYGGIGFNSLDSLPYSTGGGTVFRITSTGEFTNTVWFDGANGDHPGYMIRGNNDNFYGVTIGGHQVLYELNSEGTMVQTNLASFLAKKPAMVGFLQAPDGTLYGTAEWETAGDGVWAGSIYSVDTNGIFTNLFFFNWDNGAYPTSLARSANGDLYGVTMRGGGGNAGTVFRLTSEGVFTSLYSFSQTNSSYPHWIVLGHDGHLYGTTDEGGDYDHGTLYKMTTNGVLLWSFSFDGTNGGWPYWLIQGDDDNLYGTTLWGGPGYPGTHEASGTVFQITPAGALTTLVAFSRTNGASPSVAVEGTDGNFYGVTGLYGTATEGPEGETVASGYGTVFRLSVALPPTLKLVPQPDGQAILTWTSVAGQTYQLQSNTTPGSTNWNDFGAPTVATNGQMSVTVTLSDEQQELYRVVVLL